MQMPRSNVFDGDALYTSSVAELEGKIWQGKKASPYFSHGHLQHMICLLCVAA